MHFSHLKLVHFRSYQSLETDFGAGIQCITGNNGAGKTNILEAIHYLAMTRGWRGKTEKYALREGDQFFMVEGEITVSMHKSEKIQCNYQAAKGKKVLVDGQPLDRMSDHIGKIPLVSVLPQDTELIYDGPSVRRKFMDSVISQYDAGYLQDLILYGKILDQRNALLAAFAERGGYDASLLEPWDLQLIPAGQRIYNARKAFLADFEPLFLDYFRRIVSDKEVPVMAYESQIEQNTTAGWEAMLKKHRDQDRYSQRSSAGIHKDDLVFTINGQGVKYFGSQGQQKTFVISLMFAQCELLQGYKKIAPILLLDDIFDKLDLHRLRAIANILETRLLGQVFMTDTNLERVKDVFSEVKQRSISYFEVKKGKLNQVDQS